MAAAVIAAETREVIALLSRQDLEPDSCRAIASGRPPAVAQRASQSAQRHAEASPRIPRMPVQMPRENQQSTQRRCPVTSGEMVARRLDEPVVVPHGVATLAPRPPMARRGPRARAVHIEDGEGGAKHRRGIAAARVLAILRDLDVVVHHAEVAGETE